MIITTKTGDHGTTSLYTGDRVEKDDMRIELNGEMDELNALLGLCKAQSGQQEPFETVQRQLTDVMTIVALCWRCSNPSTRWKHISLRWGVTAISLFCFREGVLPTLPCILRGLRPGPASAAL